VSIIGTVVDGGSYDIGTQISGGGFLPSLSITVANDDLNYEVTLDEPTIVADPVNGWNSDPGFWAFGSNPVEVDGGQSTGNLTGQSIPTPSSFSMSVTATWTQNAVPGSISYTIFGILESP